MTTAEVIKSIALLQRASTPHPSPLSLSLPLPLPLLAAKSVIPGSDAAVKLLGRVNTQRFEACHSTTRADTGGSCSVLPCDSWRGPGVSCVDGKCVCPAGQCVSWKGECTLQGAVGFDWPASGVSFLVEGTGSVGVLINGDGADFVVEIDNASPGRRFSTTADTSEVYTLANFTSAAAAPVASSERRLVTLMRATEYTTKGTVLQRIMLRGNISLVPPPPPLHLPPHPFPVQPFPLWLKKPGRCILNFSATRIPPGTASLERLFLLARKSTRMPRKGTRGGSRMDSGLLRTTSRRLVGWGCTRTHSRVAPR